MQQGKPLITDAAAEEANYIAAAIAPGATQFMTTITNIMIILLGWLSVALEVFLRFDFGERYLSWLRLFFAYILITSISFFSNLFTNQISVQRSSLLGMFLLGFVGLSIWHRLRIWLRYKNRIPWHSMSFGTSRLASLNLPYVGNDDWTLYRWYEPFLCFLLTFLIFQFDTNTGFILGAASISLLIKNHMVYSQYRNRILDLIDARIEGMYYNEEAFGKPKNEVAGISVVPAVYPKLTPQSFDIQKTVSQTLGESVASDVSPVHEKKSERVNISIPVDFSKTLENTLSGSKASESQPPNLPLNTDSDALNEQAQSG